MEEERKYVFHYIFFIRTYFSTKTSNSWNALHIEAAVSSVL